MLIDLASFIFISNVVVLEVAYHPRFVFIIEVEAESLHAATIEIPSINISIVILTPSKPMQVPVSILSNVKFLVAINEHS